MASGIFAILDDITALMDDVAVNAKVAGKQTMGILGDDLAVNAEKATGFLSSREIPVLLKIMKGSFVNKLIILPFIFFLQYLYSPAITFILILGGLYLAYEGMEKIVEFLFHRSKKGQEVIAQTEEVPQTEAAKIKSAITTDFILSLEIVIIALSTVVGKSLSVQVFTVSIIAIVATVGVYGIVALIVRMDDAGYKLIKISNEKGFLNQLGIYMIKALPIVIKALGIVGTVALLLVSGGIFDHNIAWFHHFLPSVPGFLKQMLYGIVIGSAMVAIIGTSEKIWKTLKKTS